MSRLIRLNRVVIVEGKYDKIHLSNFIDATIIATNGFGVYKDKEIQRLIKTLCDKNGAVIITDSDAAGAQIRSFIKSFCDNNKIKNVYLPQIKGKEKRKYHASKQGFLGAEGLSREIIESALEKYGVLDEAPAVSERITNTDLCLCGLSGKSGSKAARASFSAFCGLPCALSPAMFLDALNSIYTRNDFIKEIEKWHQEQAKN